MTKDGRPSRILDVRYFLGDRNTYLKNQHEGWAFGRRLAVFLNGEGFSLGSYPALYVILTPSLRPGSVQITDESSEWWHRYARVGVPLGFPAGQGATEIMVSATVAALTAIRPDLDMMVDRAERFVVAQGASLRFLLQSRRTRRYTIDLSFDIPTWPQTASVFTTVTELATGLVLDGPPLAIPFYADAFAYNGPIKVREIENALDEFKSIAPPVFTKLVRRRG